MHINKVTGLLVLLCCELCLTIKVPTVWTGSGNSAVNNQPSQVEIIQPQNVQTLHQTQAVPIEYFQYTAPKPQFAANIAAFHGVNNPQEHYKAYPIKPFTAQKQPVLGIHQMLDAEDKTIFQPFQKYVQKTEQLKNHVKPTSTGYEIFHPYNAEKSALQAIYKDPTLSKIRNDVKHTKDRLQAYEQEAGQANISDDEGHQKTDEKLFPQKNIPARYEIHKAERRPIYYNRPPIESERDQVLNQRLKHPWNQNVKIRPLHYKPLKNHIHNLRQQHAMKYDDERNEYPQVIVNEKTAESLEGQDIYEKGKEKYTQLRNNLDLSINKAIQQNRPAGYQKLELQNKEPETKDDDDDDDYEEADEFIPIKNYAQVRKSETFKHVPRKAAFDDAETLEEILNAPRLREAVKSSKAQIVYSEEGYEDSAYDHAGEQKHASEHEGHGGFLKQKESSAGLYKIPKVLDSYQDDRESEYRDKIEHAKKWKNKNKDHEDESEAEDYSKDEYNESVEADNYKKDDATIRNRSKREKNKILFTTDSEDAEISVNESQQNENGTKNDSDDDVNIQHEVDKREANFEVPQINLDSTYLTEKEILKLSKLKLIPKKDTIKDKYPYYFKTLKQINKNSPLRYAENLNFIPKKSEGGTEFYDSRSSFECPEVDSEVDPVPEKLKSGEYPTDEDNDEERDPNSNDGNKFSNVQMQPRLKGLGDKIDCFKAKYFGENPLDSPFFKEEVIVNPEPIIIPKLPIYKELKIQKQPMTNKSNLMKPYNAENNNAIFKLLDKLRIDTKTSNKSLNRSNSDTKTIIKTPQRDLTINSTQQANVYNDVLTNISQDLQPSITNKLPRLIDSTNNETNVTYKFYKNKEDVTKLPQTVRKKRSTPFIYEPYKIIKDSQLQDSKKTTTTSNISPLIRQLQSSRVSDRVSRSNRDDKQARLGVSSRSYVDIGRKERDRSSSNPTIVDVSIDQRRGEPRYEIRPRNHKSEYTPVENKKTMSLDDYKIQTKNIQENSKNHQENSNKESRKGQSIRTRTTVRPFYDVSVFLPATDNQNAEASNAVKKSVTSSIPQTNSKRIQQVKQDADKDSEESEEDYDDEDEDDEEDEQFITTTSTTPKPTFRRRMEVVSTTESSRQTNSDEPERLRLITRFRNYKPNEKPKEIVDVADSPKERKYEHDLVMPKYTEKKKKSSKTTLVTDTKKYGDDDDEDDMRKEDVDALIGVRQDMDDYTPLYEKEEKLKQRKYHQSHTNNEENRKGSNKNENDEEDFDDDDEDDEDDDDDDDDEYEDEDDEDANKTNASVDAEEYEKEDNKKTVVTTPEPTKRTLVRTTDAPSSTVASYRRTTARSSVSRNANSEIKPIVTRKKIEIHKELPVNKSSPHVTQFKQDIKEVEIIKETPVVPQRKLPKKGQALELYKDDNLAKDINKLGDVEIFSDNIDLDAGPKHGGNYRKATKEDLRLLKPHAQENIKPLKDTETSQTENQKHVEFDQYTPQQMHGGNFKSISDARRTKNSGRNAKLVDLSSPPARGLPPMHGGNLQFDNKKRGSRRNEKLTELDDDHDDDRDSSQDDDYRSSPHNTRTDRLHGGNYRSAKLVASNDKDNDDIRARTPDREARKKATALLNSFVQAAPVLTTTPAYILDPSKRMYYYVDA